MDPTRCIHSDCCDGCEYEDAINDEGVCEMYEIPYWELPQEGYEDDDADEEDDD